MEKPKTIFDFYEELEPKEVVVETKTEEKLFEPEPTPEQNKQVVELPEGFEASLVEKITASVVAKLSEQKGAGNE